MLHVKQTAHIAHPQLFVLVVLVPLHSIILLPEIVLVIFTPISIMAKIIVNLAGLAMAAVFAEIGTVIVTYVKHIGHGQIGTVIAGALIIIMDKIATLVIEDAQVVQDRFAILVKQLTLYITLPLIFVVVFQINLSTQQVIVKTVDLMHMHVLQQLELQLIVMQDSKLSTELVFVLLTNLFKQVLLQDYQPVFHSLHVLMANIIAETMFVWLVLLMLIV